MNRNRSRNNSTAASAPQSLDSLAGKAGAAVGASPEMVKKAAQSGDLSQIMAKLSPQQAQQLQSVLSDEAAIKRLLAAPQAQALLKGLKKNE